MAQQELKKLDVTTQEVLDGMSSELYLKTLQEAHEVGAQDGGQRPVVRDRAFNNPDLADDVQRAYTTGWFTAAPEVGGDKGEEE